jgi:hypothetical protein
MKGTEAVVERPPSAAPADVAVPQPVIAEMAFVRPTLAGSSSSSDTQA